MVLNQTTQHLIKITEMLPMVNIQMLFYLIILLYPQVLIPKLTTWVICTPWVEPHSTGSLSEHHGEKDGVAIATSSFSLSTLLARLSSSLADFLYFSLHDLHGHRVQRGNEWHTCITLDLCLAEAPRINRVIMSSYSQNGIHENHP